LKNLKQIPVIDLFAGPGGLAEGFSSIIDNNSRFFKIELSIEKEENAHKTLLLRSFCRQFPIGHLPDEYYAILEETDQLKREKKIQSLYNLYKFEFDKAQNETCLAELGDARFPPAFIDNKIRQSLNGSKEWVLIGGPPCQAYSLAGRSRVGGISNNDKRVYLYKEYLRIIAEHQPTVFVMENVKGLLSAKLKEENADDIAIFDMILDDLKNPSTIFPDSNSKRYSIHSLVESNVTNKKDFLIKSELYGIPQKRHRVILIGIREDINVTPGILSKTDEVSLKSVIGHLPEIRSGLGRECILSELNGKKTTRTYKDILDTETNWENYINSFKHLLSRIPELEISKTEIKTSAPSHGVGNEFIKWHKTISPDHPLFTWFTDKKLTGVTHHISRSHLIEDIGRYLFASQYTKAFNYFPRMRDYEKYCPELLPDHGNAKSGKFEDRFRVQLPDIPATTITSHISKDGHYFIHYDPQQSRSLTVREAARIQTFPDNYLFCGSRTAQFHQVGNAVPPYLAYKIGCIVKEIFNQF
jgi:DNA (cytosine-5)-methyltransferase 1